MSFSREPHQASFCFGFSPDTLLACTKSWRRQALPVPRSPARRDVGGCALRDVEAPLPAIASLEGLKAAQKDLQQAKNLEELKVVFKKWRKIGWKNVCKEINEAIAA